MNPRLIFSLLTLNTLFFFSAPIVRADGNQAACTPVYGMANTCIEHQTVNTGAEDTVLYTLSTGSYLVGLISFIKARLTS